MEGILRTRNVTLAGLVLAVITVGFIYGFYVLGGTEVFAQEPTTGEQDFACSPDEQQVETFSGTADQSFPEFEIDGAEWRFIVQATSTAETSGSVTVETVFDPDNPGFGIATVSVNPEFSPTETSSSSVIDGPGTFTLEVDANGAEYDILVCESQTPGGGGGGTTTGAPKTPTTPPPAPKTPSPAPKTPSPAPKTPSPAPKTPSPAPEDSGTLMNAGGPTTGPVPMMANGSCPRELPVKRDGACYST